MAKLHILLVDGLKFILEINLICVIYDIIKKEDYTAHMVMRNED